MRIWVSIRHAFSFSSRVLSKEKLFPLISAGAKSRRVWSSSGCVLRLGLFRKSSGERLKIHEGSGVEGTRLCLLQTRGQLSAGLRCPEKIEEAIASAPFVGGEGSER